MAKTDPALLEPKMDLKSFVTESLRQIVEGVQDAIRAGVPVPPDPLAPPEPVEFDVAITTSAAAGQGGAGLFVMGLGLGGKTESNATLSAVSRIKFTIPVNLQKPKA